MSKISTALSSLPPEVTTSLARMGENRALARVRRKEPQRQWAQRIGIFVPTLIRMQRGAPGVSAGIYATALLMMGRSAAFGELADPDKDLGAFELDVRAATQTRAIRSKSSIAARLAMKALWLA